MCSLNEAVMKIKNSRCIIKENPFKRIYREVNKKMQRECPGRTFSLHLQERQARLELVTLSLGSWCSTNWATAAFTKHIYVSECKCKSYFLKYKSGFNLLCRNAEVFLNLLHLYYFTIPAKPIKDIAWSTVVIRTVVFYSMYFGSTQKQNKKEYHKHMTHFNNLNQTRLLNAIYLLWTIVSNVVNFYLIK